MGFTLGAKALAEGYRIAAFETIGSTSAEALARARAGDPGRLWVVARAQTAGRGRRGRPWETAPGNLAASLLIRPKAPQSASATLGFTAGLALENAIRQCAPELAVTMAVGGSNGRRVRLELKWPNDLLVDGAKIAGILLEAVAVSGGNRYAVSIGIGVNVRHAPKGTPYPAMSLSEAGADVSAARLFEALTDHWVTQYRVWDEGRGFATIRRGWLERAAGLGAPIGVRFGEELLRGIFETIDEEGRLVMRGADGSTRSVAAGDVHFGAAATAGCA